jgi:formate C-acetyltransferase
MSSQHSSILNSEKVQTKYFLNDFPNLKEFRDFTVQGEIEFCIERAALMLEFLNKKGGLDYIDPITRQAEILKYILENKTPNIFPDDLLAGSSTSKRKGVLFYPEFLGLGIWPELLSLPIRKKNPYYITEEEIIKLDQEIMPFWIDKNIPELVRKKLGDNDKSYRLHEKLFLYMVAKYNCQSHTIPDYQKVLKCGIEGIIDDITQRIKNASGEKNKFYNAMKIALEGVLRYANNLSKEATRQLKTCKDRDRKDELKKISEICKKVPAKPATTFREALQSIWICMNALYQEQNNVGFSIGRIDQLLNPYYIHDVKSGKLTRKRAIELFAHFWLKIGDNIPMVPESGEKLFGATGSNQAITIGGCDKEGKNSVNEATFLSLDVVELLKVRDPNLNARIREDDPDDYTQRIAEVIFNTGSTPSLISDKAVIPALEKIGIEQADANDYAQVGCLEPNTPGRQFGHTGSLLINCTAPFILAMHNGNSNKSKDLGPKTGELSEFDSFEQFLDAVKTQFKFIIENAIRLNNVCGETYKYLHPQPLLSSLFEGTIQSGNNLLNGGAKYNSSGIAFIALADLIDSLYAVKKLVFVDNKFTLEDLAQMLKKNFNDNEKEYSYILNKINHFGNDKEDVDSIAQDLIDFLYEICTSIKNYRGGSYLPGYWSMTIHSGFGKVTGAFPNGKKKSEPFTSGLTPFSKTQKNGPTAVFNSLANLDCTKMPNGMALNMKFNKSLFKIEKNKELFISLLKGYFSKGGMQVQYIIQDAETLIDAKQYPEKYPDLMVRISGYTAYFNDLNDHMKDEIINRAIMQI